MKYWYIILDGRELPTPYTTYPEVSQAMDELKERVGPCCIDCVMH